MVAFPDKLQRYITPLSFGQKFPANWDGEIPPTQFLRVTWVPSTYEKPFF
jgi:hypothetical protein